MKKHTFILLLFISLGFTLLSAQSSLQGINYQGVARDVTGTIMANAKLTFRISLVAPRLDSNQVHYSEIHRVFTNNLGLFHFIIGSGEVQSGTIGAIRWDESSIFLKTEMATVMDRDFKYVNQTEIFAVPYAYYAEKAGRLVSDPSIDLPAEKNQSIHWTTGGNTSTKPGTHFIGTLDDQPLIFKTNNKVSMTLNGDGRLDISNVVPAGPDNQKSSYPMVVDGTMNTQGLWIEINGKRSSANNFVTFEDADGVQGRVEGQTLGELLSSDLYLYTAAVFVLNITAVTLNVIALNYEIINAASKPWSLAVVIPLVAKAVTYTAQGLSLRLAFDSYTGLAISKVGVAYSSKGADYAEWLKRMPHERDFQFGEIVAVDAGLLTSNTQNAKQLMVISDAPIVLGNEPSTDIEQYEKVAFLGQLMVKVVGPVKVGDYILPSGNNDGCGVAIAPGQMKAGDYQQVVGVAWEAADGLLNYINVAVGLNVNDLANKIDELNQRADHIIAYLEGKTNLQLGATTSANVPSDERAKSDVSTFDKLISDENFDQLIDQNKVAIRQVFEVSKKLMLQKSIEPEILNILEQTYADPIQAIKKLRRDPNFATYWHSIDKSLKSKQ